MEVIVNALAVLIVVGALAAGLLVLCAPFALLAVVARKSPSTPPTRSVKDEVVAAQWEYDRLWKRK